MKVRVGVGLRLRARAVLRLTAHEQRDAAGGQALGYPARARRLLGEAHQPGC